MTEKLYDYTVDANLLGKAISGNCIAITVLLHFFTKDVNLCVDLNGDILEEYDDRILEGRKNRSPTVFFIENLLREFEYSRKYRYLQCNLSIREKKKLGDLCFHNDDYVYIGVCKNSALKELVTDDSDFFKEEDFAKWVADEYNIKISKISEIHERIDIKEAEL